MRVSNQVSVLATMATASSTDWSSGECLAAMDKSLRNVDSHSDLGEVVPCSTMSDM